MRRRPKTRRDPRAFAIALSIAAPCFVSAPAWAQQAVRVYVPAVDYPSGIRPDGAEYRVAVHYELGPSGRAANCSITEPSRQPALDAESCRIVLARLLIRPDPARLQGSLLFIWQGVPASVETRTPGEPLAYDLGGRISPRDYPREAGRRSGTVAYVVTVSPFGRPIGCTITQSSRAPALDQRTCDLVMAHGMYIPATDGASLVTAVAHGRIRWQHP